MLKKGQLQFVLWIILLGINIGFAANIMALNTAIMAGLTNVFFLALVFYGNYFVLFPRYFSLQNNRRFYTLTFVFILIIALLQFWVEISYFAHYAVREHPHAKSGARILIPFFKNFFLLWLVDLISNVFLMQDRIKEQMVQTQRMKEEKLSTELKLLKAQINPHFIFNALNNIYSLAYSKSEAAPESILKLSHMLRYVLEECSNDRVTLKSEVEYIENFIDFQRMKSPNEQNIVFENETTEPNKMISPMLFIPFIENSFKYSRVEEEQNAFVNIDMTSDHEKIHFEIRNSIADSGRLKSGAGMGIENVKQRLEIIYKDNYSLDIRQEDHKYYVKLEITLT